MYGCIDTGRGGAVHVCTGVLIQGGAGLYMYVRVYRYREGRGCTCMYGCIDTGRGGAVHVCTDVLIQGGAGLYMYVRVY